MMGDCDYWSNASALSRLQYRGTNLSDSLDFARAVVDIFLISCSRLLVII